MKNEKGYSVINELWHARAVYISCTANMESGMDHQEAFFKHGFHIPSRTIYLGHEEVEEGEQGTGFLMAETLIKSLTIMERIAQTPITIITNNWGGSIYHGLAIYDRIKLSPCHITMQGFGHIMSMGTWIMQAADLRQLTANSTFMIHSGWVSIESDLRPQDFEDENTEIKRLCTLMMDHYMEKIRQKNPTFPRDQLKRMLMKDTFLTPKETVALGLADEILK